MYFSSLLPLSGEGFRVHFRLCFSSQSRAVSFLDIKIKSERLCKCKICTVCAMGLIEAVTEMQRFCLPADRLIVEQDFNCKCENSAEETKSAEVE